jgi:peptidoglycan/xylan/chitin deacetylase (PgdA/CDA1 family)
MLVDARLLRRSPAGRLNRGLALGCQQLDSWSFQRMDRTRLKSATLSLARYLGLFALARRRTRNKLRILCYHGLWTTPGSSFGDRLFMSPEQFRNRMLRVKRSGATVMRLDDAMNALENDRLPPSALVITADDGWASTYTHMLPILEELQLPATVYVTSWYAERRMPVLNVAIDFIHQSAQRSASESKPTIDRINALPIEERDQALRDYSLELGVSLDWWAARQFHLMTPDEVADAAKRGLDIQLHTHRHTSNLPTLHSELSQNRSCLAAWTGLPTTYFRHFCYPSGRFHDGIGEILAAYDIRSATLVEQGMNSVPFDRYRLRRFLDGRSISDVEFDCYVAGLLDSIDTLAARLRDAG